MIIKLKYTVVWKIKNKNNNFQLFKYNYNM